MDANNIKFVDDDGTVEVLEPPMTARIHVETPTRPETPDLEGIQEEEREDHLLMKDEVVEIISSSVEDAVEQHVKEIEKMDNVLLAASQGTPDIIKMEEVKVPEEIDKEALSLVANAVNDVRADERVPITPKGCCILQ
jgi:hypothetical protein